MTIYISSVCLTAIFLLGWRFTLVGFVQLFESSVLFLNSKISSKSYLSQKCAYVNQRFKRTNSYIFLYWSNNKMNQLNSPPEVSCKKYILKNFKKFTTKKLRCRSFLMQLPAVGERLQHRFFHMTYFLEHLFYRVLPSLSMRKICKFYFPV